MTIMSFAKLAGQASQNDSLVPTLLQGQIAILRLNRPAARNALNADLAERLARTVRVVEADEQINVAILTGNESVFCAGADLNEVLAGDLDRLFTPEGGLGGFTHASRTKPWIAAVEGPALAGGFELALSCDLVVASKSAVFGLPEVKRGLIASAGGIYRLPRAIPRSLALEMIMTGNTIGAEVAASVGLTNRLVDNGGCLDAAIELASLICGNAPLAVRESIAVARQAFDTDDASLYSSGHEAQGRLKGTADYQEGSRAFVEKRPPRWLGH